jgi:hypothetical protein
MTINRRQKLIVFLISVSMIFLFSFPVGATPSQWAEDHVKAILLADMASEEILASEGLQQAITREEFAELVVYLYAEAKGVTIESIPQWNPFKDTKNPMVARAYNLGIVNGTSVLDDGRRFFSPDALVTREQMAVMLVNEIRLLGIETKPNYSKSFSDQDDISAWAFDQLSFATEQNIILGIGNNLVSPRSHATREQAITLVHKIALKYNWIDKNILISRFNASNALSTYGFYRPKSQVSDLQSYVEGGALTFRISYWLSSYTVDIPKQQADLIHILSVSDTLSYDAFVILKNKIENSYDSISKEFNNASKIYMDANTGNISSSPFSSRYFELYIDDALFLTYRP